MPQTSNTVPVIKPQLLPIPARISLHKDKHSFYSRESARHPDKHLITQHLALITSYRNDTANEDIEGFGVVGASSYGSHTHSTFSRCFLRVKSKTHTTLTSLLTRDDFDTHPQVTPQHNANRPLLFIHVKLLTSTDKQPSLNLSVFFWSTLSFSRRADRCNTNPRHLQIDMPYSSLIDS